MALGFISGTIKNKSDSKLIVQTMAGIGYEIYCSKSYAIGAETELYLSAIYRENSCELFGFDSYDEKLFYELLLNVKGIGPKSAFALLNSIGAGQVKKAILDKDKKLLQSAPGIGAKAAAQIILDLGNKIADWIGADDLMISSEGHKEDLLESAPLLQEALSACKELGFKESKVKPLLNQIISSGKFSKAEDLVESVLKSI